MQNNSRKIAVFISSGIGNSIMLIPLLKILKERGDFVSLILNSRFIDKEFLVFNNFPYDEIITLTNRLSFIKYTNAFEISYLDFSSSSINNLIIAKTISEKVIAMRNKRKLIPGVTYIKPQNDIHSVVQNIWLVRNSLKEKGFELGKMKLFPSRGKIGKRFNLDIRNKLIVAVQVSSGNLKSLYKNWPIKYWIEFFDLIDNDYQDYLFVLLGDVHEVSIGKKIMNETKNENIISLIGQTSLEQASIIVNTSEFYIGLDSGFMHLAVAYGKPTFTIWGGSNYNLFGYDKFDDKNHFINKINKNCHPCNSWIGKNTTKVLNPNSCPDRECLTELNPKLVYSNFLNFLKHASIHPSSSSQK